MAEPSTRKVQITVPAADTSVIEWLDLQFSSSESIRRLIREAITREGFVDVANRPVRPPTHSVDFSEDLSFEADTQTTSSARPAPVETDDIAPVPVTRSSRTAASEASAAIDDLLGL